MVDGDEVVDDILAKLSDPMWRLCSGALYKIIIKGDDPSDDLVIPFKPNRAQRRFIKRMWHRNIILKARQLGFCVAPDTRVLTADLRWARIDSLKAGDEVVAVDEHPPGGRGKARRMRTATVQASAMVRRMAYRIAFDDGREVICTDRHPWLSKKAGDLAEWRSLSGQGNQVVGRLKVGTKVRWVAKPWGESTVEDGWFGGMLDGEGSISKANVAASVNVSQRHGAVWDRLVNYALERGYNAKIENDRAERPSKHGCVPVPKLAFGRQDELFRLIGQTRPTRFIGNRFWEGRELPGKRNGDVGWATVTGIDPLGEQTMIDLQTSTGTYIAEGFVSHNTTLIAIIWLDHALFNANARCGIIAQDKGAAEVIFRDKVRFAYDNLPDNVRAMFPLKRDSASELLFDHNNSSIRVATSLRSGTIHRLHVSEFGKICKQFPEKAREVVTGSIPAVPASGILVIESTAEGTEGYFHDMTKAAMALDQARKRLNEKDYRMHFFAWWENPDYSMPVDGIVIPPKYRAYFLKVEAEIGRKLRPEQRAWYMATLTTDFSGADELMWQEYPSTPQEAFQQSSEGCYYANQIATARKTGRILRIPQLALPVNTFWDVGNSDGCAIWFHQKVGMEHRFIKYYEEHGEDLSHYMKVLQDTGFIWNKHFLPHDAQHERLSDGNRSIEQMLNDLGLTNTVIVPRIDSIQAGIQMTREHFPKAFIDAQECALGVQRLENYKKRWNTQQGRWGDLPAHDINSEGADAFRQWAQAEDGGLITQAGATGYKRKTQGNWRTA